MKAGYCEVCGTPFIGGNRRKFCSMRCKRRLEGSRRSWDHMTKMVLHLRLAAGRKDLYTPLKCQELLRRAETIAVKLGDRP